MQCEQDSATPVRKRRRHRHVGRLRTARRAYLRHQQRLQCSIFSSLNAPSSLSAGIVYYLNGENNNLAYERDDKTSKLIADAGRRSLT